MSFEKLCSRCLGSGDVVISIDDEREDLPHIVRCHSCEGFGFVRTITDPSELFDTAAIKRIVAKAKAEKHYKAIEAAIRAIRDCESFLDAYKQEGKEDELI